MSNDGFVLDTKASIDAWQAMRVAAALALEINTGMKMSGRGSTMLLAASYCGSEKRTKKGVLKDYDKWLSENLPNYRPLPSIAEALSK